MEENNPTSKRFVWIVIGVAVVACIAVSLVLYLLFGTPTREDESATNTSESSTSTSRAVATEEEVQNDLEDLDAALQQARDDQKASRAAIEESKNQTKVGS